jgi:F0F1-type ATP synthase membrane subunit b/b'
MQKINEASLKWSHEENEKKLAQLKSNFNEEQINLKNEYESIIEDLNDQIDGFKNEVVVSYLLYENSMT